MLKRTPKIICAAYRSWRERFKKGKLQHFTREDSRSRLARLVDLCCSLLLTWVLTLLLLNTLGAGMLAPFAATALTAAIGAATARFQRKRYRAGPATGRKGAEGENAGSFKEDPEATPHAIRLLAALRYTALRREKACPYLLTGIFLLACRLLLGPQLPASSLYFLLAVANLALGLACLTRAAKEAPPQRPGPVKP